MPIILPNRRQFIATTLGALGATVSAPTAMANWGGGPPSLENAEAAILIDVRTGKVLYEKNSQERRQVASTQKILTALVLAEGGGLKQRMTITPYDLKVEPTRLGVKPGDVYQRGYLMQAMLVKSCNDVARALARDFSSSEQAFAAVMTQKAARLGARQSRFLNASGLPVPGQFSTARDIAIIARAAYSNSIIRQIVRIPTLPFTFANGRKIVLENTNKLLKKYSYINGMKTGYTNGAGKCLVSSASYNGRDVVAVILGSRAKYVFDDSRLLLDYGLSL
jgi:serine-type D-Ala-D-Ala carboxypeptidase (penicillin-binding protein 5/6)